MAPIKFVDAHVTIGRPAIPKYHVVDDPEVMKKELAEAGVTGGLVRHAFAAEGHPLVGNEMLSKALAGTKGFEPVWTLMPHWTGEFPAPEALAKQIAAGKVRSAIMYPAQHGFPLRPAIAGPVLDMLEAMRMPLFLPIGQADLRTIEKVMRRHPSLPVIVSEAAQGVARELYALLEAFESLYVETSGFMLHLGIEDVYHKFGAERLIFGTRYPLYNPGSAVAAVMYATIPNEAKALIASGNIERILGEVRYQ
jgi:hypothetical protein